VFQGSGLAAQAVDWLTFQQSDQLDGGSVGPYIESKVSAEG
jgi:hypothetical protein